MSAEPTWLLRIKGVERGPYRRAQILAFLDDDRIDLQTPCRLSGQAAWTPLGETLGLVARPATASLGTTLLALPLAALVFALLDLVGGDYLLHPIPMAIHELGHASAAWLCGRWAIPLPYLSTTGDGFSNLIFLVLGIMVTFAGHRKELRWLQAAGAVFTLFIASWFLFGSQSNPMIFLLLIAVGGLLAWLGWSGRSPALVLAGATLVLAQIVLTLLTGSDRQELFFVAGGIGGEFVIGTLLVLLWFGRLPAWLRWGALCVGMLTLVFNTLAWHRYAADPSQLPLGTAIHGRGDSNGDLNRLMRGLDWSPEQLIDATLSLSRVCLFLLAVSWVWAVWRAWRSGRRAVA